ncbi:MAG: CPBP family intramembrane metalloprotease [Oscillospiraceae bacterium]|jgi:membrane protease YdiL (CAAX protease family)|nr:CPBP family intramembrane metalloprotease [Oscillospiraceae bacterium]
MYRNKDVFFNSTEFDDNSDYRRFYPKLMEGETLPEQPTFEEDKLINHYYSKGSAVMLGYYFGIQILVFALVFCIRQGAKIFLELQGKAVTADAVKDILSQSILNIALNAVIFLIMNVGIFFLGCKVCKINKSSIFSTRNLNKTTLLYYIFFALGLQFAAGIAANIITSFMKSGGVENYTPDISTPTVSALLLSILYSCIIAPVTEELLYRGFVLRAFSIVSQRTGIFVSSLFFAIGHQNTSQAILAFVTGLLLGYIAVKHNSIIPCIIVHCAVNSYPTLLYDILPRLITSQTLDIISTICFYSVIVLGFISAIVVAGQNDYPQKTELQKKRCYGYISTFTFVAYIFANLFELVDLIVKVNRK